MCHLLWSMLHLYTWVMNSVLLLASSFLLRSWAVFRPLPSSLHSSMEQKDGAVSIRAFSATCP